MALLAGGDVLALLVFATIGRFSHGLSILDLETLRTADPFIAGVLGFHYCEIDALNYSLLYLVEKMCQS